MPQVRKAPAPDLPATVKTVTRTVEQVELPSVKQDQPLKPDISEFFASLTPNDRKMYSFYLTRLDPNIEVTDPRVNNPSCEGAMVSGPRRSSAYCKPMAARAASER